MIHIHGSLRTSDREIVFNTHKYTVCDSYGEMRRLYCRLFSFSFFLSLRMERAENATHKKVCIHFYAVNRGVCVTPTWVVANASINIHKQNTYSGPHTCTQYITTHTHTRMRMSILDFFFPRHMCAFVCVPRRARAHSFVCMAVRMRIKHVSAADHFGVNELFHFICMYI